MAILTIKWSYAKGLIMKRAYHFLGSAYFAVILIFLSAIMVAAGTFLESTRDSHQVAAEFIYKSAFFKLLLIGFFLNILISAMRRWPFKLRHLPFLITHLGLLMLIAGTFVKTVYGTQGNLLLVEGSSSSHLQIPDSMVISATAKEGNQILSLPLTKNIFGKYELPRNSFCTLAEYFPHSEEKIYSWIVDGKGLIYGEPTFLAHEWQQGETLPPDAPLALLTNHHDEAIDVLLLTGLFLNITETATKKNLGKFPLHKQTFESEGWKLQTMLKNNVIQVNYENSERKGDIHIALTGPLNLFNQHKPHFLGKAPLTIDLVSQVPFTILQDDQKNTTIAAVDPYGKLHIQKFPVGQMKSYFAFNHGFDGYAIQAEILGGGSRNQLESLWRQEILHNLSNDIVPLSTLLPIKLFQEACEELRLNFSEEFIFFLEEWHEKGGWLYPEHIALSKEMANIFRKIDWSGIPSSTLKSSLWLDYFYKDFDRALLKGDSFLNLLKAKGWPLDPSLILLNDDEEHMTLFSQQLFSIGDELPWRPFSQEPEKIARIFSAMLRNYGIHFSHLPLSSKDEKKVYATFESPITKENVPKPPLSKIEDNLPLAILNLCNQESIALTYKSALKWPTKDGSYLLQFHSQKEELPYSVRLHKAKQINYPSSDQVFSYESELTFKDRRTMHELRKIISMNQVHETWDGYRFYLAGLSESASGAHVVQLVVNRDPAKYLLTYPGGLLIALGILMLFWWKPQTKKY